MKIRNIMVWLIAILVIIAGSYTAISVGKYVRENHYTEPQFRDMNGTPNLPFLIAFTIMFFTLITSSFIISRFARR